MIYEVRFIICRMNTDDLKFRTKKFALRVMNLIDALPDNTKARVLANQLMRSATSVGANYRAAVRGRSRKEFAAKIGISLEECDESAYWLELIIEGELLHKSKVESLQAEANELCAILFTIQRTTRENDKS